MGFGISRIFTIAAIVMAIFGVAIYLFSSGERQKPYIDKTMFGISNGIINENEFTSACSEEKKETTVKSVSKDLEILIKKCPVKIYLSVTVDNLDESIQAAGSITKAGKVIKLFGEKEDKSACEIAAEAIWAACPSHARDLIKTD